MGSFQTMDNALQAAGLKHHKRMKVRADAFVDYYFPKIQFCIIVRPDDNRFW
jgi:hypothetical protein